MVEQRVAMHRRQHAERHADRERDAQARQGELERGRQALQEILQHRPPGRRALAEIAMQQAADIAPVLHVAGWSRPIFCSISAMYSGVASRPARTRAGLPGSM